MKERFREDDDLPVTDRRRFTADGSPRTEFDTASGDADETGPVPEGAELVPSAEAREWERRARAAEEKLAEVADSYRRGREELQAARARLERDQDTRVKDALGRAFSPMLAALDNLERALAVAPADPFADGVRLVHRQLIEAMAAEGLERIVVVGRPFDPETAEAVMTSPAETPEQHNVVVEELAPGFALAGRVVRPAKVRVAI